MLPVEDAFTLPLLYHLNSEPWLNLEAYADPSCEPQYKEVSDGGPPLALPPPADDSAVRKLLQARRSCRRFAPRSMPLSAGATLLAGAYGLSGLNRYADGLSMFVRPVPSAGGLYPLELYAATRDVEGLPDGTYHYSVLHHRLEPVATGLRVQDVGPLLLGQEYLQGANLVLFLTAVFARTLRKYGARGYRYILLEVGHCAQALCLLAAESGLATLCVGGFQDTRLNRLLGLDGTTEAVLYCVGVGYEVA